MTKRHFEAFARWIKGELSYGLNTDPAVAAIQRDVLNRAAQAFATLAAGDNGRFDRGRFMTACGF